MTSTNISYARSFAPHLMGAPLIVFDRDGTLTENGSGHPHQISELVVRPGIKELFLLLRQKNVNLAIATNQSGVGRHIYDAFTFEQFNSALTREILGKLNYFQLITACFHVPEDKCKCRKPEPAQLEYMYNYFKYPSKRIFIGDSSTDRQAAERADFEWLSVFDANLVSTLSFWLESDT